MRNILFLGEEVKGEHTFPKRIWIVKRKHLTHFTLSEGSGRIVLSQLFARPLRNKEKITLPLMRKLVKERQDSEQF